MKTAVTATAATLYNPHEQSHQQLIERFVVRQETFQELFQALKSSSMQPPEPHYLIEGQRGAGKTTLLLRLAYAIEQDPQLQAWLIPIVFKEEAYYGIRRLYALWETVAQELEAKDEQFSGLHDRMLAAYEAQADYDNLCFEMLAEALEARGKKLVLCIDNLGEMLYNFSDQENQSLRDILQRYPAIRLIGATAVVLEAYFTKDHPFYGFFSKRRLEGVSKEETYRLLSELAKVYDKERVIQTIIDEQPGRIESLRLLTGGVIRSIVLLFEIFTEREEGTTITDLDAVLDRVTPLYKSRMDDLTPLQREVVNTIALHWDAISPEEIARKARLKADDVQTVLQELQNVFIVEQAATENSAKLYRLKERFFNIWYLMRLSLRGSQSKVLWLLHFLETWYGKEEFQHHARRHLRAVATGQYAADTAYYLTEAFARSGQLDLNTEYNLIQATRKLLKENASTLAAELSASDKEIFEEAEALYQREAYEEAIQLFLKIKRKSTPIAFRLGNAFSSLGYYQEAVDYLRQAARRDHVDAMLQLGLLYHYQLQDHQKAERYYLMAEEKGNLDAMLQLGHLYSQVLKDVEHAEQYYLLVLKEAQVHAKVLGSGKFSLKALKNYLVTAIKGSEQDADEYDFPDFKVAKTEYLEAIERTAREAMFALGTLYAGEVNDPQKALTYYKMALEKGHVKAMVHVGLLYQYELKNPEQAATYYEMAVEQGERQYAPVNLGFLYQNELHDPTRAERYYLMAIEQDDISAMNGLAWLYFEQKIHKEEALRYAQKTFEHTVNMYTAHTLACIYLWNNAYDDAIQTAETFMYDLKAYEALEQDILCYLMLLLAKELYETVSAYFAIPELRLRERFKPLYYVLLHLTKHPDFAKLPPELEDPVKSLLQRIRRMAQDYR